MRKHTLLMIVAGLVLAGPAWGEPFEDGKRAYLRGDDRQARTLLRQAVKERPRDPVRREWLAKVYDRLLQPLEALIERDMAAKIRAGAGYRPQPTKRPTIRITQFDVMGLPPLRQSVNSGTPPAPTTQRSTEGGQVPTSGTPPSLKDAQFLANLGPNGSGSGFQLSVAAIAKDGGSQQALLAAIKQVIVRIEAGEGQQTFTFGASEATQSGSTLKFVGLTNKLWAVSGSGAGGDVFVRVGEDQVTVPPAAVKAGMAFITVVTTEGPVPVAPVNLQDNGLVYLTEPPKPYKGPEHGSVEPPKLPG